MDIKIKNDLSEIRTLSEELEKYCLAQNIAMKSTLELTLALEEIATNIISYGYQDNAEHIISISIDKNNSNLITQIKDDGVPFNPLEVPPPDLNKELDQMEPGGLGIHLVKNVMDEVSYRREQGLNILTLVKKLQEE